MSAPRRRFASFRGWRRCGNCGLWVGGGGEIGRLQVVRFLLSSVLVVIVVLGVPDVFFFFLGGEWLERKPEGSPCHFAGSDSFIETYPFAAPFPRHSVGRFLSSTLVWTVWAIVWDSQSEMPCQSLTKWACKSPRKGCRAPQDVLFRCLFDSDTRFKMSLSLLQQPSYKMVSLLSSFVVETGVVNLLFLSLARYGFGFLEAAILFVARLRQSLWFVACVG